MGEVFSKSQKYNLKNPGNQIKGMAGVFRTIPEVVKDFDDLGIYETLGILKRI